MPRLMLFAVGLLLGASANAVAQPSPLPPPNRVPQLVIDHGGPHAPINALAFAPDGTLYAGGFGKVVHRYALREGKYVSAGEPIRVPIGPNNAGAVNAIAVSPKGKWVAVAGRAPIRGEVWSGAEDGLVHQTSNLSETQRQDFGVVYLFNPENPRGGKVLRGAETGVLAMTFAQVDSDESPVLVTAGIEEGRGRKQLGTLRVFDVASGKEQISRRNLPTGFPRPGLAAWGGKSLHIATAWPADPFTDGNLVVWDVKANTDEKHGDGKYNIALALRTDGKSGAVTGLVSSGIAKAGQIVDRPIAALANGKPHPLGNDGKLRLPVALATVGADCAVVCVLPQPNGVADVPPELLIVSGDGKTLGRIPLDGIGAGTLPTLAASRDGRTLAVAGFADDRIEIHDVAKVAASQATPQTLAGAPRGHARIAFLAGDRLWLGKADEIAPAGGTVLDFITRKAAAGTGDDKIDGPPRGGSVTFESIPMLESKAVSVEVAIQGVKKRFALGEGEHPTTAALLPAGPKFGAVLAIAHRHDEAAKSLITLFDAATQRPLVELSGPALAIEGLAFSQSRPLLAAVGPDRAISVWSLRGVHEPFSAIEGLTLEERNGVLVVASLANDSPAKDLLKVGDIIASVGAERGDLKPVRAYHEFLRAVRSIPIGKSARIQVKGAAAPVVVAVGRGLGHRHPLFELWVNPVANADASHDWIGWTPAGPYDTNSPQAESRLGWLTATGDPAAPTVYAGADQYRRQYYKPNFLRFLAAEGEFGSAFQRYTAENPRTAPTLSFHSNEMDQLGGRSVFRSRPAQLEVRLDDPDGTIPLDQAVLRWRGIDANGVAGEWREKPFTTGRAAIEPPDDTWHRGLHRFEVAVQQSPDLPPTLNTNLAFQFIPTAPALAILVNGEKVASGADLSTENDEVVISADVRTAPGEKGEVWWTASIADAKPRELAAMPVGKFGPATVRLNAKEKTVIRLTALNVGSGKEAMESAFAEVTLWRTPKPREVPRVRLSLASPADLPTALGEPHLSDTRKVRLSVAIAAEKFEKLEWDDGDEKWIDAKFKPTDPAKAVATREVTLAAGGEMATLRARVTAGGSSRIDQLSVVWAGLPEADIANVPLAVTKANLVVRGTAKATEGGPAFTIQILVDSPDSLAPLRSFAVVSDADQSWSGEVELKPGINRVGLVVANKWKQTRIASRDVRYLRPPQVVATQPIAAKGANVGDVVAVVVTPEGLPPDRLVLDNRVLEVKRIAPIRLFGAAVWRLRVESVPLEIGGALPKSVQLAAGNAEGVGPAVEVAVIPKPVEPPPPPPPEIALTTIPQRSAIPRGATIRTDQPRYEFGLEIASVAKLVRIGAMHARDGGGQPSRIAGVNLDAVKPKPSGFALIATPDIALHEGVNHFVIEAATDRGAVKFEFSVSYTPPPVRITVDSIVELVSKKAHNVTKSGPISVDEGIVEVRGRIVWTAAAATKRLGFEVVLVANEVRHPSIVLTPPDGKFESEFTSKLFLNAKEVAVRVEVDRFGAAVAREKLPGAGLVVRTPRPIGKQRLHVVVIAPNAPEEKAKRAELAREVITAIGGETPPGDLTFDRGSFKHAAFPAGATFYAPLVGNINPYRIRSQIVSVKDLIDKMAGEPQGWVNDVVLVYYRGLDECDKKEGGRLMLATCEAPLRVDELPATPGVRLLIINTVNDSGDPVRSDPVRTGPHYLRYVWRNAKEAEALPNLYRVAVREKTQVGEVVDWVRDQVKNGKTDSPALPNPVRDRTIGIRDPK